MVVASIELQFAIIVEVDTHIRKTDLLVVYTNNPVMVEKSINTLEQLLVEDDKHKVVGFDLEYTGGRVGHDEKRSAWIVNSPDYKFATVDTTNDLKVLKTLGLSFQKLVNIQGQYKVWGGENKKHEDSLVELTATIIDPYYRDMKAECDMDKSVWHTAWVNKLDE
ncbi:hypothetical protein D1007_05893 [Hordeum vulgare]|nr:hypothetical protein D1007_05893 [Hordeum vulgare]